MRRGWSPFYRWRRGNVPWHIPLIPSYLGQTAILQTNSPTNAYSTDVGEAVGDHRPKFRPNGASGGSASLGGRSPQTNSDWAQFWLVSSCGLLDWAYEVWQDLEVVCFGFGLFSPCDWALICLIGGPSPLELMTCDVMPYLIAHFECIFYVFHEYPPTNG